MFSTISAYAAKHGLFQKHGLDATIHAIPGGSDAAVALIAGEVQICEIASPAVVNAALAGEDLVFVAGIGNRQAYWLMVNPEITTPEELKGKALAVSSPGSGSDTVLRFMLQSIGLQPDVDVTVLAVGGNPERLAAMESGQIAGTALSLPESARAESMGYRALLEPTDIKMDYQANAVISKRSFLMENRSVVASYVKAIIEAVAQMKTDAEGAKAVMVEHLGLDPAADAAVIDFAYERFFHQYLNDKPYVTEAGVQALIDAARQENPTARELVAGDIIDATIVQELDKSGFIDGVYNQSSP
jgi:NitT/TauT family transport system substrate-binding protein